MRTSNGIVLATPDGQYVTIHEFQSWGGGPKYEIMITPDLKQATVFGSLAQLRMKEREMRVTLDYNKLPVHVVRTIELTGWGLSDE